VAGRPLDEEFVLGVIRELSEGIGPRLGGSEGSHRARDYLAELLAGLGLEVTLQPFT
jgi:aminopeptidase YwaD